MKKIFLILVFSAIHLITIAQDYNALHSKYWYYRTRLRNDFMKVGLTQGCSIPMEERGDQYEPYDVNHIGHSFDFSDPSSGENAKWGDAMGELGYYIGVLATEYHLLVLNNQETDSVRYELYCALETLNRMDYWAETAFNQATGQTHTPSYDGFMVRDDVPHNFVQNNMKHFNYFGNRGFCSNIKIKDISTSAGNDATLSGHKDPPNQNELKYAGSYISQDNWINCLVGLALIRKFVQGVNYKNLPFSDGNGPDINQEAFSIALRVLDYFKQDANWALKYPSGTFIGGDWGGITFALAFAHAETLNKMDQNKWGYYSFPDPISFNNTCQFNNWITSGNVLSQWFKVNVAFPLQFLLYSLSPHVSGDLHNVYSASPTPLFPLGGEGTWKAQLQTLAGSDDVDLMTSNIAATCNCDYSYFGNLTKGSMQGHIHRNNLNLWHADLLRMALHGYEECSSIDFSQGSFDNSVAMILDAPCGGSFNYNSTNWQAPYEWSTQTRLDHSGARGGGGWIGEYNGIDFMFYHNLVNIIDIEKNGLSDNKQMVDFGQRHIITNYPTTISGQSWGNNSKPATVKSYEYIVADNTINSNANVTYLAGKEITLRNGFSSINTNSFTASIQQFACSDLTNPLNPSVNARSSNTDDNQNNTVYPDIMATGFEHTDLTKSENTLIPSTTYSPSLVHIDSLESSKSIAAINNIMIQLAPNPSNGISKLFISKPELIKAIDVIDPIGKLLFTLSTISYSNDIDLSSISKGIYSIVVKTTAGEPITKKIVIQ